MAKRSTGADGVTTVRGKRANGGGSVYFDKANECYFATWNDATGKRRKVRGKTQAEAERRRDEAIDKDAAGVRGSPTSPRIACARRRSARSASV